MASVGFNSTTAYAEYIKKCISNLHERIPTTNNNTLTKHLTLFCNHHNITTKYISINADNNNNEDNPTSIPSIVSSSSSNNNNNNVNLDKKDNILCLLIKSDQQTNTRDNIRTNELKNNYNVYTICDGNNESNQSYHHLNSFISNSKSFSGSLLVFLSSIEGMIKYIQIDWFFTSESYLKVIYIILL